jgi:hypothetical protein
MYPGTLTNKAITCQSHHGNGPRHAVPGYPVPGEEIRGAARLFGLVEQAHGHHRTVTDKMEHRHRVGNGRTLKLIVAKMSNAMLNVLYAVVRAGVLAGILRYRKRRSVQKSGMRIPTQNRFGPGTPARKEQKKEFVWFWSTSVEAHNGPRI